MRMGVNGESLCGWWLVSLFSMLSVASLAAADLRLADAVEMGDKEAVRSLLAEHVDVNTPQADGATPLAWAAHRDDLETAGLLIRAGADANTANNYGVTPLSLACTNRSAAMVKKLLEAGADPNAAQPTGETALMRCAHTGSLEAMKLLIEHGADVNAAETWQGQTALMWAAAEKHPEIVRTLLEHGADVHARSNVIPLPEPFLIETPGPLGFNHPTTVHFPKTKGGFTPLLFAAQQGDVDSARILLEAGAEVNEATAENGSVLVVATASGHEELAVFLLEQGADPNATDGFGISAMHYALHEGLLTLMGAKRSSTDRFGWLRPNMPELVKTLLAHGADPNARIEKNFPTLDDPFLARATEDPPQIDPVGATPFML
ncbi:MAG: ankyrin repeat domain-containing protein, partial [Acidobacteria bacterium]|nr:ankyrin repeat domain-containing protein [Acidobacteriota bacterium]